MEGERRSGRPGTLTALFATGWHRAGGPRIASDTAAVVSALAAVVSAGFAGCAWLSASRVAKAASYREKLPLAAIDRGLWDLMAVSQAMSDDLNELNSRSQALDERQRGLADALERRDFKSADGHRRMAERLEGEMESATARALRRRRQAEVAGQGLREAVRGARLLLSGLPGGDGEQDPVATLTRVPIWMYEFRGRPDRADDVLAAGFRLREAIDAAVLSAFERGKPPRSGTVKDVRREAERIRERVHDWRDGPSLDAG